MPMSKELEESIAELNEMKAEAVEKDDLELAARLYSQIQALKAGTMQTQVSSHDAHSEPPPATVPSEVISHDAHTVSPATAVPTEVISHDAHDVPPATAVPSEVISHDAHTVSPATAVPSGSVHKHGHEQHKDDNVIVSDSITKRILTRAAEGAKCPQDGDKVLLTALLLFVPSVLPVYMHWLFTTYCP